MEGDLVREAEQHVERGELLKALLALDVPLPFGGRDPSGPGDEPASNRTHAEAEEA